MTTTPMNFRVPAELKAEFERTCRRLSIPMSAQLNLMMREFVRLETAQRQQDAVDNGPIPFFQTSSKRGKPMMTIIGNPTNQNEVVQKLQLAEVMQFGIHQHCHPSEAGNLIELANDMADVPGNVTIILVRTL